MTIRLILILLVAALIVAIFFADPIYNWFKNIFKSEKVSQDSEDSENSENDENEKGETK